jgi:dethiobiotin synthetase
MPIFRGFYAAGAGRRPVSLSSFQSHRMLRPLKIPGLFITATDTGVGKTVIASAIANWFHRRGKRVGVCKIVATGCILRGDQLVSEDAESLARASGSRFPLEVVCPIRYAEPLAPAVAAERAGVSLDWSLLQQSLDTLASQSDVLIVEGVGGVMVPMDDRHTVLDVAAWLKLPAIVVARPALGTINHTVLTVNALRAAGFDVAGVVINRCLANSADVAEQTNPAAIEKWGRVPVLCRVPEEAISPDHLSARLAAALDGIDWLRLSSPECL